MSALRFPFHVTLFAAVQPSCVNGVWYLDVSRYLAWVGKVSAHMSDERHRYEEIEDDEVHNAPHGQRETLHNLLVEFVLIEPVEYVESIRSPTTKVDEQMRDDGEC
jgi:hypothetical protein